MPFWTEGLTINSKDPKRNFRFRVSFGLNSAFAGTATTPGGTGTAGAAGASGIWYAKKVTQPSVTFGETKHDFMMHTYYWPGKVAWNEVELTLVDPVEPHVSYNFLKAIEDAGFSVPSATSAFKSVSKATASLKLGTVVIELIDETGTAINTWTLANAWAKEISFSGLDYSSEDLMEVTLKVRYDWAQFLNNVAGGGTQVFAPGGTTTT